MLITPWVGGWARLTWRGGEAVMERSSSTVLHRTVMGGVGAMLLASTALVLISPSTAVALPTPLGDPAVPSPDIRVPLPAVLRIPMPAPAWLQPPSTH